MKDTVMNKTKCKNRAGLALLLAGSAVLLQACGGGDDGANYVGVDSSGNVQPATPDTPVAPSGNTGAVSAAFVKGEHARYMLIRPNGQTFGRLDTFEQTDGAVVQIDSEVLSNGVVREIAGDAGFALGRWHSGSVTNASGAVSLTGTDGRAYHYLLFNGLAELPTSGSFTCDAGTFTAPTRESGAGPVTASATGNASLVFGAEGAAVDGQITLAGGGEATLKTTVDSTTSTSITGAYFNQGAGAAVLVADAGNGAYAVAGSYRAAAGGSSYTGVYRFLCK